jgi:WD40 repeat protein/serine/threonine protein kinase
MTVSTSTLFCIVCGREFRPRDADTVICPDCGGPPEAPAPSQPQGTVLADQPRGTVLMSQPAYQRMCILCGQDFTTPDPQADRCPQCRGEAPQPQPEIRSRPESRQSTPAMPARPQGTVAVPESSLSPAPSSADVPLEWNAGDVILDLYEVKGELGKGGMGVVYRVHHRQWNIDLAVKTPLPEALQKAGSLENFLREAQAWVDLGLHPHIVTCYYVRRLGEMPRVFAECMEGGSLKNWMEDGRLYAGGEQEALKRILDCAIQFAWGLGYAHEKGLVHQDVKPANALMTPEGMLKVTDFGLVGAKGYTPAYAAPEQELGQAVSPRTDLWGWGVSVLEMFTGGVHWQFGSVAASVLENYLQEAPPEGIPPMPAALAELLRQCFQNDPDQRPASMDEVAERLIRLYKQETGAPYPRPKPQALDMRADSLNNKAVSLLDLGQEEEAVRCWQEALQADPAHLEANFNYGYYRWQRAELLGGFFLKQMQMLQSSHATDEEYWRLLAWTHFEHGELREAMEICKSGNIRDENLYSLLERCTSSKPTTEESRTLVGHVQQVKCIAFSPDGRYVLSGSFDEMILWDTFSGQAIRKFNVGHDVWAVAFTPDERYALSGGDENLVLWDVRTGKEIRWFKGQGHYINSIAVSPDGQYVLLGGGSLSLRPIISDSAKEWSLKTCGPIRSVSFSSDGKFAFAGGDEVIICDAKSGLEIKNYKVDDRPEFFVFSPDCSLAIWERWPDLLIWDVFAGKIIREMKNIGKVKCGAFSSDGCYFMAGCRYGTIRMWEVPSGREIKRITASAYSLAISPNDCFAIFSDISGNLKLYPFLLPTCKSNWKNHHPYPVISRVREISQLRGEKERYLQSVACIQDLVQFGNFEEAYRLIRETQCLRGYKRDRDLLQLLLKCVEKAQRTKLKEKWRLYSRGLHSKEEEDRDFLGVLPKGDVTCVVFAPNSRYMLSGHYGGILVLWDVFRGEEIQRLRTESGIKIVAFSDDGRYIISCSSSAIHLWDAFTWNKIRQFERHFPTSLALSYDSQFILTGDWDGTVTLLDTWNGRTIKKLIGHTHCVSSVAFSPDGYYALSGSWDRTLILWDVKRQKKLKRLWHEDEVLTVAFSPSGLYAVSGSRDLRLWDIAQGKEISRFVGHTGGVRSAAFFSDGRYVISGSTDMTIRVWDVATVQEVCRLEGHRGAVNSVALSPDGRYALSGSEDNTICLWEFDWDYDFPAPADWDEGARPYLDIFLTLHTPYAPDGLRRVGKPQWTEEDFQKLLQELGYRGYGWLRPEGVRRELEKMAKERK